MLKVKVNQLLEENKKLKSNLEHKSKDWQVAEEKAQKYESRAAKLSVKYQAADAYRKKAVDELYEIRKEVEYLQHNIQSLREEITHKEKNHLQELREHHEGQMREMKMLYEQKIKDLQAEANRESVAASSAIEELDVSRQNIESLYIHISKLEATNAALNGRNFELGKLLANERRRHASDIAKVDAELQLREEVTQQLQESAAYDKLLCDEENSSQRKYFVTTREIAKYAPKVTVQNKGTNEVQVDGRRFKCKIAPVSQWNVTSAADEPSTTIVMKSLKCQIGKSINTSTCNADEKEVAGADGIKHTIIHHVSNHRILNEESSSGEKNPLRRKWIYHVFHRGKRSPHPSWLLKVLGAIT
ncbi:lamin-C-like [Musca autumnalis]|uniref:lamin-C-like n=1 Tax=Musca autumnalis TaxID=221902 RepID=UPI003CF006A0